MGSYYDVLRFPRQGNATQGALHGGSVALCATTVIEALAARSGYPVSRPCLRERLERMPRLWESVHPSGAGHFGTPSAVLPPW